ncbi:MAG: formate dehydrogenase subunit gamma [Salaquimonas sp.]
MTRRETEIETKKSHSIWALFLVLALALMFFASSALAQSSVRPPDNATQNVIENPVDGNVPGNALGNSDVSNSWGDVRKGVEGTVSIPDTKAGVLVQSAGEDYRLTRKGPLFSYLGLAMLGTLIALAIFFALRGRIKVEHGLSGKKIKRFSDVERMGHWLMAISFIILAISGLNVTFGKYVIMPVIGKDAFGPLSLFLKTTHHYIAFAFMLGLAIAFVCWVVHNIPSRHDIGWLLKGGGLFSKGVHPPAKKFNAGQKMIFWLTMIGGLSLCLSGWQLLFPFEHNYFADTFTMLAKIGIDIPAMIGIAAPPYSGIQEQQFATIWHVIMAVVMICVIMAHIYIGSVGMEGAFDAMGSGEVDENWAIEHHSLWVEEVKSGKSAGSAKAQPAE